MGPLLPLLAIGALIAKDVGLVYWGFKASEKSSANSLDKDIVLKRIDETLESLSSIDDFHINGQVSVAIIEFRAFRDFIESLGEKIPEDAVRSYIANMDEALMEALDGVLETAYSWTVSTQKFVSDETKKAKGWFTGFINSLVADVVQETERVA